MAELTINSVNTRHAVFRRMHGVINAPGKAAPNCFAAALLTGCAMLLSACSDADTTSVTSSERVELRGPIRKLEAREDIEGLADLLIGDFARGDIQMQGSVVVWSSGQERARDAITKLVVKDPSAYQTFSDSIVRLSSIKKDDYDWSGVYFADALRKHVATMTLADLIVKEDVEMLIDFHRQLIKNDHIHLVGSDNLLSARETIQRLTSNDALIHARADAQLAALRESSNSEHVRKFATHQLSAINTRVLRDHGRELLDSAFVLAGLDPNAETIAPPGSALEYTTPNTIPSGLPVDIVFHWLKPPLKREETWSDPEIWQAGGILQGRTKAEIDAYFDEITHVGLFLYESSRNVGGTVGTRSDGSECVGAVIQNIYYSYRIGLEDKVVEGMRLMGHVNPPGQAYLDGNCNTTAGLPIYDPFVIRARD